MTQLINLKGDINNNGKIDNNKEERTNIELNAYDIKLLQTQLNKLKRKVDSSGNVSNRQNEFASSAKIAEELTDGRQRVFFNNVGKTVVFKNSNKPMSSCVQIGSNDNSLRNISHIHFQDGSELRGLINDFTASLTPDEARTYVPTMNVISHFIDPRLELVYENLNTLNAKTHDITYDEEEEETNISHDLAVSGEIKSNWLNTEFGKYALVGHNHDSKYASINHNHDLVYANINHNHDSKYAALNHIHSINDITNLQTVLNGKANVSHQHEFADIYKSIVTDNGNGTTTTTTKTLQQVLTEYEQSMTALINGKANISHQHEMGDIYKETTVNNGDGTTTTTRKTLDQYIIERENAIKALINGKANISHTHNATDIIYKEAEGNNEAVNVKQELDNINEQLDVYDSQGQKLNILSVLFGVGAAVGTAVDGGLVYAVITLQSELAALQAEISGLGMHDLGADTLETFDEVSDIAGGGSNWMDNVQGWARSSIRTRGAMRGYERLSTQTITPVTTGLGEMTGLVPL